MYTTKRCTLMLSAALAWSLCVADVPAQSDGGQADDEPVAVASTPAEPAIPARASQIIGTPLIDSEGLSVGSVEDLVVGAEGDVVALVQRPDGLMIGVPLARCEPGLAEPSTPVARAKEEPTPSGVSTMSGETPVVERFSMTFAPDLLDSAPTCSGRATVDAVWLQRSMAHFGVEVTAPPENKREGESSDDGDVASSDLSVSAAAPRCLEQYLGDAIASEQDEEVGSLSDVAIDLRSDRVAYAVVRVGSFLGVGGEWHAVAFDDLTLGDDGTVTTELTEDGLSRLPALDIDHLSVHPVVRVSDESGRTPLKGGLARRDGR